MTCPVCKEPLEGLLCQSCGFDGSRDYEHHPTLAPLSGDLPAISALREERCGHFSDSLCCAACSHRQFSVSLSTGNIACCSCGAEITEDRLAVLREEWKKNRSLAKREKAFASGCTVVAIGRDNYGQCSVGDWKNITAITAGEFHTVGLRNDGTVAAVGNNTYGQCKVEGWESITAVAAGGFHTVGLRNDGSVAATGDNKERQCQVGFWRNIVAVAAGMSHTVGLRANGTVVAAGDGTQGQCRVSGWKNIVAIAAGPYHTVGLKSDGTVIYAGFSHLYKVSLWWNNIVKIAAGVSQTVGLRSDGMVVTQEGKSCSTWRDITDITASDHIVGLRADGTAVAVGRNNYGQCILDDWRNIVAIAAGGEHTVGLVAPE